MKETFRNCKWCGKRFLVMNPEHIYCCSDCVDAAYSKKLPMVRGSYTAKPKNYITGSQSEAARIAKEAKAAGMEYGEYVAKNKL